MIMKDAYGVANAITMALSVLENASRQTSGALGGGKLERPRMIVERDLNYRGSLK